MDRRRTSLAIALVAGCGLLASCMSAGPGGCDPQNREFFDAIEPFDGASIEAEDHPLGICGATFTTDEPAEAVIEHYAAAFEAAGWDVNAGDTIVSGYRDTYQYHVEISEARTGEVHVNITAGNSQQ